MRVEMTKSFAREAGARFGENPRRIIDLLEALEYNPGMGKLVGDVSGVFVRELEYEWFRFYFIVDGGKIRVLLREELMDLMLRFAGLFDRRHKKMLWKIREILTKLGIVWF